MYFKDQQFTDKKLIKILLYQYFKKNLNRIKSFMTIGKSTKMFLKDFPWCFALKLLNMLMSALFW